MSDVPDWYSDPKEVVRASNDRLREKVLSYYGGGKAVCVECGFEDIRALTIDHKEDNGSYMRKALRRKGVGLHFYRWLKGHNYPEGYQTLCMNCQFIKEFDRRRGKN